LMLVFVVGLLGGCGKSEETTDVSEDVSITDAVADEKDNIDIDVSDTSQIEEDTEDIVYMKDGKIQDDLNGEWVTPESAEKRYVSFMVNNISEAMPQSGVEEADVIYEMLEEGGITRLLCIFRMDTLENVEKIGPIRSARHYFDRKNMEYEGIFVHWGQSIYAQHDFEVLSTLDQIDLNGKDSSAAFRVSRPGKAVEHTGYTSGSNVLSAIESDGFSTTKSDTYESMFSFNYEDTTPDGTDAIKVTTAYSSSRKPWFEYDSETGLYNRFQYGESQIDENTGNQLAFKNVIVQFCTHRDMAIDEAGCIDITLSGTGEGYYFSDGKMIPITWEKIGTGTHVDFSTANGIFDSVVRTDSNCEFGVTKFYTEDGEELKLNPGKTFVTIFPDDIKDSVTIE